VAVSDLDVLAIRRNMFLSSIPRKMLKRIRQQSRERAVLHNARVRQFIQTRFLSTFHPSQLAVIGVSDRRALTEGEKYACFLVFLVRAMIDAHLNSSFCWHRFTERVKTVSRTNAFCSLPTLASAPNFWPTPPHRCPATA
jgi:hypothetical protein